MDIKGLLKRFNAFWETGKSHRFSQEEWLKLGYYFLSKGDVRKVEKIIEWSTNLEGKSPNMALLEIQLALQMNELDRAKNLITDFKKNYPGEEMIYPAEYEYFKIKENLPVQRILLEKLHALYPGRSEYVIDMIYVLSALENYEEVFAWTEKLFLDFPRRIDTRDFALIAGIYRKLAPPGEYVSLLERYIKLYPFDSYGWHTYALYWREQKDYKKAEQAWSYALAVHPEYLSPYLGLAGMYEEMGAYEKANLFLEKSMEFSDPSASVYTRMGRNALKRGLREKALTLFGLALEEDKTYIPAWNALVRFHRDINQPAKALEIVDTALRMIETKKFYVLKAEILLELGQKIPALENYKKALELGYRSPEFLLKLASLYKETGNLQARREILWMARKLYPGHKKIQEQSDKYRGS